MTTVFPGAADSFTAKVDAKAQDCQMGQEWREMSVWVEVALIVCVAGPLILGILTIFGIPLASWLIEKVSDI